MADVTPASILAKTATGAGWIIGWRMFTRILGLANTFLLVRLLLPEDFGLVALAMSLSQAIDALSSLGVEEAVIREKAPSSHVYDSAFTINVIRGLTTSAILAACAWPVGLFFHDARLFPVMLALAAGSLVGSFENIGIVDFRRGIAFEKEFLLMSVPRLTSIVVSVGLACIFRSYWALVAAILTSNVVRVAMGYKLHPYRPRFSMQAWRQIAGFSFWSWLLSLTSLTRDRSDSFVIGRLLDITQVGIFSVGVEIASLAATELVSPLARACFSGFASARNAGLEADTGRIFLRVIGSAVLLALPASVGVSLIAGPIVKLALGSRWIGATIVIQVLGVALSVMILGLISASLLNAYAALRGTFRVQLISVAVRVPLMIVLVPRLGLLGAAAGMAVATSVEHLSYLVMTLRRLHLTVIDVLASTWRCVLSAGAMAAVMAVFGLGWNRVPDDRAALLTDLLAAVSLGAVVYGGTVAVLWVASGRPPGAESSILDVLRRSCSQAAIAIQRQRRTYFGYAVHRPISPRTKTSAANLGYERDQAALVGPAGEEVSFEE